MKYIHDGQNYLIFSAYEGLSHAWVAQQVCPGAALSHAGFALYENKSIVALGNSYTLKLESKPFELGDTVFAARDSERFNAVLVSNNPLWLIALGLNPEPAFWHKARVDEDEEPREYLDIQNPHVVMSNRAIEGS